MKHLTVLLISMLMLFSLALYGCADKTEESSTKQTSADYETVLFDTDVVHQIDIQISEEDWDDLLAHPVDKTKYKVDITIDDEVVKDVAFSTKGNSSLIFVAAEEDSPRYSFKINFGKFADGQTYHGLNKLNLNNNYCDATYLKDYFSYKLFRKAGVPAPLTSFAWLTVNGKDHGLYLAIEDESDSFLDRVSDGEGVIYKPESKDLDLSVGKVKEIRENGLPMTADPHGADLIYKDDNPESYPDIFENAETEAEEQDDQTVIAAIKSLSDGTDLSTYLDTDEIIRFFAAHNFVLNYDSYTGAMLHNLVLFENNGKLSLVPWDYNLAFGTFVPGIGKDIMENSTNLLNQGIDSPLIGVGEESRPMWKWIVNDSRYLKEYHDAFDSLITEYYESGEFDREAEKMYELLLPYVEKDPTAFYSADQYRLACEVFRQFCDRRAESIRMQLDGELASINGEQIDRDKVDASDLNVMDMGAFVDKTE